MVRIGNYFVKHFQRSWGYLSYISKCVNKAEEVFEKEILDSFFVFLRKLFLQSDLFLNNRLFAIPRFFKAYNTKFDIQTFIFIIVLQFIIDSVFKAK